LTRRLYDLSTPKGYAVTASQCRGCRADREYNAVPAEFRFDGTLNKLTWENKEEPLTSEEAMVISAQQLAYAVEQVAAAIRALTDLYARK
jgi:hypothetical protein